MSNVHLPLVGLSARAHADGVALIFTLDAPGDLPASVDYTWHASGAGRVGAVVGASGRVTFDRHETIKVVPIDVPAAADGVGAPALAVTLGTPVNAVIPQTLLAADVAAAPLPDTAAAPVVADTAMVVPSAGAVSDAPTEPAVDPVATPRILIDDIVVSEGSSVANVVVRLDAPGLSTVTVNYGFGNFNAANGADYSNVTGTLTFLSGETEKTIPVTLLGGTTAEAMESFFIGLNTPTNATFERGYAVITIADNDTVVAAPQVFVRDVVVDEKAGTASFVVLLGQAGGQASNTPVTVNYATANGTATAGTDYLATSGTLTFAAGESAKTVVVSLVDDATAEGLERFGLTLSGATGGAVIVDGSATASIGANDGTALANTRIQVSDYVVDESEGYVDVVISLSAPAQTAVSVRYYTSNGGAANGTDFGGLGATTLNFAPGETTKVVRIPLYEDASAESLQNFYLNLDTPSANATIVSSYTQITIVDNDTVVAAPQLLVRDVIVDEKAGTATFVVMLGDTLGQSSSSTVTVNYTTANGSATAGSDYVAASGTLTFAPGESVKTVVVDITDDATAEGAERFNLTLSNATGGAVIVDGSGQATIGASDATAVSNTRVSVSDYVVDESEGWVDVVVSLSSPAQTAVTVRYYTQNGTAAGGSDYQTLSAPVLNFAPGETTKVVRVQLLEDPTAEEAQNFYFVLDTPSANATIAQNYSLITIADNDAVVDAPQIFVRDVVVDEKAGTATFVVSMGLTGGQSSNSVVTVDYATTAGSATPGSDFTAKSGTLTFAPGDSVKTIVVDITDDTTAEALERFGLTLSNATGGAVIVDGSGQATIGANDATATANTRILVSDYVVDESEGYIDMVVSLSAPAQSAVTVRWYTSNGSAAGGADYQALGPNVLNFAAGETSKVVRIPIYDDVSPEELQNFFVAFDTPSANATIVRSYAQVMLVDNDTVLDTPSVFVRDVVVDEKAGTATFVVTLGNTRGEASNSTITVDYATANGTATAGTDYTAASGTLTFASGETSKTVVVDITDDTTAEGLERFGLNLSNATGGAVIVDGSAQAEIGANDAQAVAQTRISVADYVVDEGEGFVDVVVTLSSPAQSAVTVRYYGQNGTAANGSDYQSPATQFLNFAPGETTKVVRVQLLEDASAEQLQNFYFVMDTPSANATIAKGYSQILLLDNDTVVDTPSLYVRDTIIDEKAGTATFVVTLGDSQGQASNNIVTVNYATGSATATAGSDFTGRSGTLTFAPGESVKTIVVDISDDAGSEASERINLTLSNPVNATIADSRGVAIIGASDTANAPTPVISIADTTISEHDGFVDVVLTLSAPSASQVTVSYFPTNVTASNAFDYTGPSGTATFAPGQTTVVVRVPLLNDSTPEANETFRVNLQSPVGATIGNTFATVTIVDDDTPGVQVLSYGLSDDIYDVDDVTDVVLENVNGGTDLVQTTVNFTLPDNVENIRITGAGPINATGNALANTMYAGAGNNVINGSGGTDTVSYQFASGPVTVNLATAGGQATVNSGVDTLVSVEYLIGSNFNDTLSAGAGVNRIDGGTGADTMSGGAGNDTYIVDNAGDNVIEGSGAGFDTVNSFINYTLGNNVENLRIVSGGTVSATGNATNNVLYSGAGNNVLDGAGGTDIVSYLYASGAVTVSLATAGAQATGGSGSDTLLNLENLTGSNFADTLSGNAGDNRIDGGKGGDTMLGGAGNDVYDVDNAADSVIEDASAGIDTVYSALSAYTLGENLENLRLMAAGTASGTGNTLNNVIYAGAGNNVMDGGDGSDTVSYQYAGGAVSVSLLVVGAGQATGGSGTDTLSNFENLTGSDFADSLTGDANANRLDGGTGADTMSAGGGNDTYVVDNAGDTVVEGGGGGVDTVNTFVDYSLVAEVENLRILATGTVNVVGNSLGNVIYAGNGNNSMNGGGGADTASYVFATGAVNVSLAVAGAQATGGSGSDTLTNFENLTGSNFADTLAGNSAANVLTGGGAADVFVLNSVLASDTITDFASGVDDLRISQAGISVGDGDTVVEGATTIAGPGGFLKSAELVVVTQNIAGAISSASAAAAIGSATTAYAIGESALFMVDNGGSSALYRFVSADTDATVEANELQLLATLTGTASTTTGDVIFGT